MIQAIKVHEDDNVAVVVSGSGMKAGDVLESHNLTLLDFVPQGHKIALVDIPAGSKIIRYGVHIATAKELIPAGSWVSEQMSEIPSSPALNKLVFSKPAEVKAESLEGYTFWGYRNPEGSVGTRNVLGITTCVQCVSGMVNQLVRRLKEEELPKYPHVDNIVGLNHSYGCGVAINAPAAIIPIRSVKNLSTNPNLGGEVMMVGLGCEKLEMKDLEAFHKEKGTTSLSTLIMQDERYQGYQGMMDAGMELGRKHLEKLNNRKREECPVSDLVVGMQCGGSDAFSGITANPAIGYAADLLVRAEGTAVFSEVTEVRDAAPVLASRCSTEEIFHKLIKELDWYDRYLNRGGADRSANTTPGNKSGGLVNIVEKAMGSVVKSGSMNIADVVGPGEKLTKKGLVFAATPASDFVCGTCQLASGISMQIFSTGRGTPYSLPIAPVIKVSSRKELSQCWFDIIDLDAGRIAYGEATIEEVGWELFHLILDVASGKTQAAVEKLNIQNDLVLFNPAPIT
ncbi:galactarate dehydratase [Oceanispirochaeta sp.]|jgi:galactarate dehydratase|uniref:galactarate dehydratase n=1 Tax=Oceanispirochaeta sp. TaxID=2035350 RepID=UPI00260DF122|nr:galactarate dehydratase [Oceanispirochaeta sp.]MDA3957744.1 galactarate dehydratase [Oceanispirochaeta sp.]